MAGLRIGCWSLGWICGAGFDGMTKNYCLVSCCCATNLVWVGHSIGGLVCGHGWSCVLILFIRH